jgi:hypothetical protein
MFATLVIFLPSTHTGGAVRLQQGQNTLTLSTEKTAAFDCLYQTWYADVTYEVSVLVYHTLTRSARAHQATSARD